jgi:predicted nucleic acid-binding protein
MARDCFFCFRTGATLSSELCSRAAENTARDGIDTIDLLHLALMSQHGISLILTDDSDFANLSEAVTLLTDNQKSLTTAAEWGLLARR